MEEGRQLTKERAGKIRKANRVQKIRASEDGVSQSRRGGAVCPVVAVSLQVTWGPAAQGPASGLELLGYLSQYLPPTRCLVIYEIAQEMLSTSLCLSSL